MSEIKSFDGKVPKDVSSLKDRSEDPKISGEGYHPHSREWASIVKPFGWIVLILVGLVIVIPFIVCIFDLGQDQLDFLERWSFMILAPIIGLACTVVGYYFGSSGASK